MFEYLYDEGLDTKAFVGAAGNKTFLDHYHAFRKLNAAVCPFCGIENYVDRTDKLEELKKAIKSDSLANLEAAASKFGDSFEKRFLFERIVEVKKRMKRKR